MFQKGATKTFRGISKTCQVFLILTKFDISFVC